MDAYLRFEHPELLWLIPVTVGSLLLFFRWAWKLRNKLTRVFVKSRLLASLTVGVSRRRQFTKMGLYLAAMCLLVLAMARPQYGFRWQEVRQKGLDIVVAIDTSKSMLANDIAPNRLERARLAALDLMNLAQSDRLGLVSFAGSAFLQCPLTMDDEAFKQNLETLDTQIIPQAGTALKEALEIARQAFGDNQENFRVIVLVTDGEDHVPGIVEAARDAAAEGFRIFTVGVGTPEGELLMVPDERGRASFLKDRDGNAIKSRLNEALLQQVASEGGGFYVRLQDADSLEALYEQGLAPLPKSELSSRQTREYYERFYWPLALGLFCLVAESFIMDQKRVRRPTGPIRSSTVLAAP